MTMYDFYCRTSFKYHAYFIFARINWRGVEKSVCGYFYTILYQVLLINKVYSLMNFTMSDNARMGAIYDLV